MATCSERWNITKEFIRKEALLLATLFAVITGIVISLSLRHVQVSSNVLAVIELPGYALLSMLRLLVLPIVISSVITGSATLTGKSEGRIAGFSFLYFLGTSFVAAVIGLVMVVILHPGSPDVHKLLDGTSSASYNTRILDTVMDLFRNAFPSNLIEACIYTEYTQYLGVTENMTDLSMAEKVVSKRLGANSLGLIIFCVTFGICMGGQGEQAKIVKEFFICLDKLSMKLVLKLLWLMPLGVISLICAKFMEAGDIVVVLRQMGLFVVTILVGLFIELFLFQALLYWIITKKNPYSYLSKYSDAAITAFGLSSSSAAIPVTLKCAEEKCNLDPRVSRFVIPIGVQINMDGTALFITAATIFFAQMNLVQVGAGGIIAVLITATTISVAAISVPSASIFFMVMCLSVIGAPVENIGLLFTTEWLLDRARTVNNVLGDAFACGVVEHLCREELREDKNKLDETQLELQLRRKSSRLYQLPECCDEE